jgi:hypothetical protein
VQDFLLGRNYGMEVEKIVTVKTYADCCPGKVRAVPFNLAINPVPFQPLFAGTFLTIREEFFGMYSSSSSYAVNIKIWQLVSDT